MAEQSSLTVAVRAFVMLGCLVVIPLVAVFGDAFPGVVDQVLGMWWPPGPPADTVAAAEAPLFEPLLRSPSSAPPAPGAFAPGADAPPPQFGVPDPAGGVTCDSEGCSVLPASYEAAAGMPPRGYGGNPSPHSNAFSEPRVPPADRQFAASPPDRFQAIRQRLKELGSTYVLLESWGDEQELFRFYCKVAVAGNPHYAYRFEATSSDPLAAMAKVLQQVEAWRTARRGN